MGGMSHPELNEHLCYPQYEEMKATVIQHRDATCHTREEISKLNHIIKRLTAKIENTKSKVQEPFLLNGDGRAVWKQIR